MFQNVRGIWSALGVMLSLIALYLMLTQAAGASSIIRSAATSGAIVFRTLQGK